MACAEFSFCSCSLVYRAFLRHAELGRDLSAGTRPGRPVTAVHANATPRDAFEARPLPALRSDVRIRVR